MSDRDDEPERHFAWWILLGPCVVILAMMLIPGIIYATLFKVDMEESGEDIMRFVYGFWGVMVAIAITSALIGE